MLSAGDKCNYSDSKILLKKFNIFLYVSMKTALATVYSFQLFLVKFGSFSIKLSCKYLPYDRGNLIS